MAGSGLQADPKYPKAEKQPCAGGRGGGRGEVESGDEAWGRKWKADDEAAVREYKQAVSAVVEKLSRSARASAIGYHFSRQPKVGSTLVSSARELVLAAITWSSEFY